MCFTFAYNFSCSKNCVKIKLLSAQCRDKCYHSFSVHNICHCFALLYAFCYLLYIVLFPPNEWKESENCGLFTAVHCCITWQQIETVIRLYHHVVSYFYRAISQISGRVFLSLQIIMYSVRAVVQYVFPRNAFIGSMPLT